MTLASTKCGPRQMAPSRLTTSKEAVVEAVDEEVAVKEVKVKVVKAVKVVKVVEITIIVVGVKIIKTRVKETIATLEEVDILDIKLNVILTNLLSNHVFVTGPSEKVLIFVWNQLPVHGRTSLCQSLINETSTSSTTVMTTKSSMICYIATNCQKYIH